MNEPPPSPLPWTAAERLELWTEIIKAARVSPEYVMNLVQQLPTPNWGDIALPRGRTLHQCQALYYEHIQSGTPVVMNRPVNVREQTAQGPPPDVSAFKRPFPGDLQSTIPNVGRYAEIQPKPLPSGDSITWSNPSEPLKKKRGRPTKADVEMRSREADNVARQRNDPNVPMWRRDSFVPSGQSGQSSRPDLTPLVISGPSLAATQAAQVVMTSQYQISARSESERESSAERARRRQRDEVQSRASNVDTDESSQSGKYPPQPQSASSSRYPNILADDIPGPSNFRGPR